MCVVILIAALAYRKTLSLELEEARLNDMEA